MSQLRQLAPGSAREIQELVREMQMLDSKRFPGNPAMVEEMRRQVMNGVDKLELELRRNGGAGDIRAAASPTVPTGYQDAVADYYRRLGKVR